MDGGLFLAPDETRRDETRRSFGGTTHQVGNWYEHADGVSCSSIYDHGRTTDEGKSSKDGDGDSDSDQSGRRTGSLSVCPGPSRCRRSSIFWRGNNT